jgi:threonine dehydrogenase-like Zn-dependent dehydrogenase
MKALFKAVSVPSLSLIDRLESSRGDVKRRLMRTGICGSDLHIASN